MAGKKNKVNMVLPTGSAIYPKVHRPDTEGKFATGKYQTRVGWPEWMPGHDTLEANIVKIAKQEWGDDVDLDEIKRPYTMPEDQTKDQFQGMITLNCSTKFKPDVVDSKKKKLPKGCEVWGGDEIKLATVLIPYESTEKVRENGKMITVTVKGVSCQMSAVMLVKKMSGGGGASMFDEEEDGFDGSDFEEEDGYEAPDEDDSHRGGEGIDDNDGDF